MQKKEVVKALKKYFQLMETEHFVKYEKDFACRIQRALTDGYNQGFYEPKLVSSVERIITNVNGMKTSFSRFRISTRGIFIHGNRSRVEFEYYGQKVERELGDLIFILSIIYNGKKQFEKFTISQFKRDREYKLRRSSKLRWNLSNKEQIYLLSRFPSFRGIKGSIIPKREFNLPNYSGCLGSFNLLFRPGDFVFVSATLLESFMGNRKFLDITETFKLRQPNSFIYLLPINKDYFELLYLLLELEVRVPVLIFTPYFMSILGTAHYAFNVYEFVGKYLRGNIGELTYSGIGTYNVHAFNFLHELLSAIIRKARMEERKDAINFVNEFFRNPYSGGERGEREGIEFDPEGGSIGIIYTQIDLGEGE